MNTFETCVAVFVILFIVGGLIAGHFVDNMNHHENDDSNEQL